MLDNGHKVIHKLNPSDLNSADKMKFDPSIKLMNRDLIDHLRQTVPDSHGTVAYLEIMKLIYESYTEDELTPSERVKSIW